MSRSKSLATAAADCLGCHSDGTDELKPFITLFEDQVNHTKRVNCVGIFITEKNKELGISAGADKKITVWHLSGRKIGMTTQFVEHASSVNCLAVFQRPGGIVELLTLYITFNYF